jgi:hypothetical protein
MVYTSNGTIFTNAAKVFVEVARTSSSGSLMRPRTGTIMKMTYARALMSSFCTMSKSRMSNVVVLRKTARQTVDQLRRALTVGQGERIGQERYDVLNNEPHGIYGHHVADCGKTSRGTLPDNGVRAPKGDQKVRQKFDDLRPQILMERRHYGFKNTHGINDVLTELFAYQLVRAVWRL